MRYFLLLTFILSITSMADKTAMKERLKKVDKIKAEGTINWHEDEECRVVFFTVLEGLYRDGTPKEVVDLVVGKYNDNELKDRFIFQCRLCHATYEAFALYQKRPNFYGIDKNKFGSKEVPQSVIKQLQSTSPHTFGDGLATIVQPWIKAKLMSLSDDKKALKEKLAKYIELAKEGFLLSERYTRCQACEAIKTVSQVLDKADTPEADLTEE